jgi:hypothetical protein
MRAVLPVVQNLPLAVRPLVTHEGSDKTLTPQQDYFRVGGEHDSQLGETQKSQRGGMARNTMAVSTPVLCAFAILADTRDDTLEPTPWVTGIPST